MAAYVNDVTFNVTWSCDEKGLYGCIYSCIMHAYILVYNAATAKIIAVKNFEVGAVIHFTYTATTPSELRLDLVSDQGDHLFLFKIQYNEYKNIVLNSFLDNAWGAEESPAKHRRSPSLVTSINTNIEQISYGAVS